MRPNLTMESLGVASLLREERRGVAATYALTLLEMACTLAYPALTGVAVDRLVKRDFAGLIGLVAVWLVHLAVSFARQRLDTRVFMSLHGRIASRMVGLQQHRGYGTSTVSGRVEMVREVAGFLEKEVPAILTHVVGVVGSLVMLFVYDTEAGWIATAVLLPTVLGNAWYWRAALRLNRGIHDQIEREVDAIASGRRWRVERHFRLLRRWRVRLSDSEAWTWGTTELATIAALVFMLIVFTRSPHFTAGAIYAVIAYVYDYLEGLYHVPTLVNDLARLKDVRARLQE